MFIINKSTTTMRHQAILQESSKPNPYFLSQISSELEGFNTSIVKESLNIFDINTNKAETA